MKRSGVLILVILASLLLGGCWPYWHDRDGHGREHGRYYDGDRESMEYHRY